MSIEAGLLADIIDHPDDDSLRLIYSDWLEDAGQHERADFIRLDLAKERGELPNADRERRRQLYKQHHLTWSAAIDRLVRRRVYRRGLVESVHLTGEQLRRGVGELNSLAPIREIDLCESVDLARIAGALAQSRASRLDLSGCTLTAQGLQSLVGREPLPHLVSLELSGPIDLSPLGALLGSPILASLTRLSLTRLWGETQINRFIGGALGGVRELAIGGYLRVDNIGWRLATWRQASQLSVLDLRGCSLETVAPHSLASSVYLNGLERLDLRNVRLSALGRDTLVQRFGGRVLLD